MPHERLRRLLKLEPSYRLLPRFTQTRVQFEKELAKAILETGEGLPQTNAKCVGARSAEGDPFRLRGIPVVGARGVGGAVAGTKPEPALMAAAERDAKLLIG